MHPKLDPKRRPPSPMSDQTLVTYEYLEAKDRKIERLEAEKKRLEERVIDVTIGLVIFIVAVVMLTFTMWLPEPL